MSEVSQAPASGVTAGALLRAAREAAAMPLADLAATLKVSVAKLEALEEDRLASQSDSVFTRALASSVCRVLKVDASPILACLPSIAVRFDPPGRGINEPYRGHHPVQAQSFLAMVPKSVMWAAVALLLGALSLSVVPDLSEWVEPWRAALSAKLPATESAPKSGDAVGPNSAGAVDGGAGSGLRLAIDPLTASVNPVMVAPRQPETPPSGGRVVDTATAVLAQPPVDAAPAPVSVAQGLLSFVAIGESWIQVTDARGAAVFSRVLKGGESTEVSGTPPLNVTVGRADAVRVAVRGKALELTTKTRDNVARFEVK